MRPASVEQLLRGRGRLDLRTAALIRAFIAAAEYDRLAAFHAPIEQAYSRRTIPPLTREVIVAAQTADLDEDEDEMLYHVGPCEQTARRWVTGIDRERSAQLIVREALVQHWELR
jgi:hypothetical protein